MEYTTVAEARGLQGLRLVLSMGSPGPWGIAARTFFKLRGVPFVPVGQELFQPNEELVAWTGVRNAPVAVYNDEPPLDNWLDILRLAERLGSGPSLLPADPIDRVLSLGFSAEICGRDGFGWSRRLTMTGASNVAATEKWGEALASAMRGYGAYACEAEQAPAQIVAVMRALAVQLHRQRAAGSSYLVGDRLSASDVHWAAFSQLVDPLPQDLCAFGPGMRDAHLTGMTDDLRAAVDPILIAHRDAIFERYIGLPLDF